MCEAVRFRCQSSREHQETRLSWRGCIRSRPPHLSRPRFGDPFWWERSRASLWLGFEFHFQPLLGGSLGSLQTFDNEAKYTLESEEVWAAAALAGRCVAPGSTGHPHPSGGDQPPSLALEKDPHPPTPKQFTPNQDEHFRDCGRLRSGWRVPNRKKASATGSSRWGGTPEGAPGGDQGCPVAPREQMLPACLLRPGQNSCVYPPIIKVSSVSNISRKGLRSWSDQLTSNI